MGDLLVGKGIWQAGRPTHLVRQGLSDLRMPAFVHQVTVTLIDAGMAKRRILKVHMGFCQTTLEDFDGTLKSNQIFAHGHGGLLGQVGFFSEFEEVIFNYNAKTITLVW
jgi:hypothetical protein